MGTARLVWAVVALLAFGAAGAPGQSPRVEALLPGVEWEPLTAPEAFEKAKRETKLLLVWQYKPMRSGGAPPLKMWKNPTLGLYVKWHAVPVRQAVGFDGVMVIKGNEVMMAMGSPDPRLVTGPGGPRLRYNTIGDIPMADLAGAASLLLRFDLVMDRLRTLDPVWLMLHEERNPPPEPPPMPPPLHLEEDGLADVIEDPEGGIGAGDVWDRLELARRAAEVGNLHYATGLYTWLWEKGEEVEPMLGPALRSVIAGEIAELARRREPARERFATIRDARARRLMWESYDRYHEWCVLSAIAGDDDLIVEFFDYFINDEQEATMIPGADRHAYELMLARERFADPWELGSDPVARVTRIEGLMRAARPVIVPHDDWERLRVFIREHLLHEGCRLHAACLRAGMEAEAGEIAAAVVRGRDTGEARVALVVTALVAGVGREMHARLLDEADGMGVSRADLRERLAAALDGAATADER